MKKLGEQIHLLNSTHTDLGGIPHRTDPATPVLPVVGLRGGYQLEETDMTLGQGLAEYYRVNPGLSNPSTLTDVKSAEYFHCHDCTHVIFGTHTGVIDEIVNDLWTIYGVQIRLSQYAAGFYATAEGKKIAKKFDIPETLRATVKSLRLFPEVRRRGKAMTQKWPWVPPQGALDRPLVDIRAEYGIQVFHAEAVLANGH